MFRVLGSIGVRSPERSPRGFGDIVGLRGKRVSGLGLVVDNWGLGFGVQGLGFRAEGF